jgi:hypothetical protein
MYPFIAKACSVRRSFVLVIFFFTLSPVLAQSPGTTSALKIGRVKYAGGGDWYNDPSGEVNLLRFVRDNTQTQVDPRYEFVDLKDDAFFAYPVLFLTGHGNISFSENEVSRLRTYLENGGFLYADDDYGMDKAFRREMKKVFPSQELVELPFNHGLYHVLYDFSAGPPKINEHDGKPAQGFGLFYNKRLVVYYTYQSNPGDGWTDPEVHNTPEEKRLQALRFGTNLIVWTLLH